METKYTFPVSGVANSKAVKAKSSRKILLLALLFLNLSLVSQINAFPLLKKNERTGNVPHTNSETNFGTRTSSSEYILKIKYSKIQKILRLKQHALAQRLNTKKLPNERRGSDLNVSSELKYSASESPFC